MKEIYLKDVPQLPLNYLNPRSAEQLQAGLSAFLDVLYSAKPTSHRPFELMERAGAIQTIHQKVMQLDRGVYALSLLLPKVKNQAKRLGLLNLIKTHFNGYTLLNQEEEAFVLDVLWYELPRVEKFVVLEELRKQSLNRSRVRKFFLRHILSEDNLEEWSVKYRHKLRNALQHLWGQRKTSIIREILTKKPRELQAREQGILGAHIDKYLGNGFEVEKVYDILRFLLAGIAAPSLTYCRSFVEAKEDLLKGAQLPYEILEGIRSVYHADCKAKRVLELIQNRKKNKPRHRRAKSKLSAYWEADDFPAEQLYRWAYARGMKPDIRETLAKKANKLAEDLVWQLGNIGILVDNSYSMRGRGSQTMHPISMSLAIKDSLCAMAQESLVVYTSPVLPEEKIDLIPCRGDSCIADKLLGMIEHAPEIIFILSDGYENAPKGRTKELLKAIRGLQIDIPVIQINPIWASDLCHTKRLSPQIPCFPVHDVQECVLGIQKMLLEADYEKGIQALLGGIWKNIQDTIKTQNPKRKFETYAYR